jgi:hypothetical protein
MSREIITPARLFVVELKCEKCIGTMITTGKTTMTYPMGIYHQCEKCGAEEVLRTQYPNVRYEKLDAKLDLKNIKMVQDN